MVVVSRPYHFLNDLERGSLIRVPVSFGHIVGSGKAKRYSTGSVKAKFIGWHETISDYVLIEYEGFSMTVHVGQVWRDSDEIAG
jgi:hypothetical protein